MVLTLLDKGAPVDARSKLGFTALLCATANGHTNTSQALLSRGASVLMVDEDYDEGWCWLVMADDVDDEDS